MKRRNKKGPNNQSIDPSKGKEPRASKQLAYPWYLVAVDCSFRMIGAVSSGYLFPATTVAPESHDKRSEVIENILSHLFERDINPIFLQKLDGKYSYYDEDSSASTAYYRITSV